MKKIFWILLAAIAVLFTACDGAGSILIDPIVGEWVSLTEQSGHITFEFKIKNTVKYTQVYTDSPESTSLEGTYYKNGNELTIEFDSAGNVVEQKYTFLIDGDKLTLTDEYSNETILSRVE